ncbi:hypothetical protein LHFGNBLO_006107 (plasmid) [Mesorhizobium sp. AR10]|uniref:hypothetical protein n=1 Tax=Mesorhizobium sp. AR10 TaxID=2865839 RepID=UPI00215F2830|nr:hypothetical protein [Mesorhizobium sp. AR10]UVK35873.1 hypothetical protein LHFGNBLO_006107 [Mesorhizobium sp. AR10]
MAKPVDKPQIDKFREAARELKTDQSDAAFEAVLNKIAHAPKLTNEQIKELVRRKREAGKG